MQTLARIRNGSDITTKLVHEFLKICEWLRSNKLSLNALKTEFMIISSHQRVGELGSVRTIPVVRAQGKVIKRVNKTKSLGLVIDEFLTWDKHIEYITKKIKQNLGMMKEIKGSVPRDSLRPGGAGPTSPTLVGPKIFIFMVKALYFQSSGRTNNCQIEVLFKWSDQSCAPSPGPVTGYVI